jgi:hypothetical protein
MMTAAAKIWLSGAMFAVLFTNLAVVGRWRVSREGECPKPLKASIRILRNYPRCFKTTGS